MSSTRHAISRQRHENVRRRTLTVTDISDITPRMRRITFASPELADFQSAGADDHIRLFFESSNGGDAPSRNFTPRAYDQTQQTLIIDFALHSKGPATEWAAAAKEGSTLEIGGPRGSAIVPDDFDWYVFIGDESALPAIGRWIENLRADVPVISAVTLIDQNEIQSISTQAAWKPLWLYRGESYERDGELLLNALRDIELPAGDGFVFIAGERQLARTLRNHFVEERQHPEDWLKASDYWSLSDDGSSRHRRHNH